MFDKPNKTQDAQFSISPANDLFMVIFDWDLLRWFWISFL